MGKRGEKRLVERYNQDSARGGRGEAGTPEQKEERGNMRTGHQRVCREREDSEKQFGPKPGAPTQSKSSERQAPRA